jgi:hypothetical protein
MKAGLNTRVFLSMVVRAHDVTVDRRYLGIRNSAILNDKSGLVESAKTSGDRRCADKCSRLHTGDVADTVNRFGLRAHRGIVVVIFPGEEFKIYLVQALRIEAGIDVRNPHEALHNSRPEARTRTKARQTCDDTSRPRMRLRDLPLTVRDDCCSASR